MKKLLIVPFLLTACKLATKEPNRAEIMVKAQAPTATCKVARAGADIAICDVPNKDKIVQFVAVYSDTVGFKAYPLVDQAPEGQGSGANAAPPPAPVATPDTGTGSASK